MNLINKILNKSLGFLSLFLLFFIPLYPKLPLVDIKNTWVYVRVEDFLVLLVLFIWFYLLVRKKATLKSPLTVPIFVFWLIGAVATIHGVIIIFPTIASVFPNVALLSFLRHIEYLSLFFVAFTSVKNKKFLTYSIITLVVTLILVIAYGFGQKYMSFPAFLTMNEEYAKGIPITVSPLNRISSTFAGHYDLAAYLVLTLPIVASLIFGVKNLFLKAGLLVTTVLGTVLMLMTVSRVSFFALGVAIFVIVFFNKKKFLLFLVPIVCIAGVVLLFKASSLLDRFNSTVKEVNVLVDTKSGADIGQIEFKDRSFFDGKTILNEESELISTPSGKLQPFYDPSLPLQLRRYRIGSEVGVVQAKVTSTGETLPQGSSYINLSLSPVTKRVGYFFYEYPPTESTSEAQIRLVPGDFLVKRAAAYDLSFTTRFQGEWPHALEAFGRNLFFGSGYGSVSLAVDNNYFRMLGETGVLGTVAFAVIFIVLGLYAKAVLPSIDSPMTKSFTYGLAGGIAGLFINAALIDVFEASKVAFVLWILIGIGVGTLALYQAKSFNLYKHLILALTSPIAIIIYIFILTGTIFSTILSGYFAADDFTWLRWAAECKGLYCNSNLDRIMHYFLNSDGFFYRPGTKAYFLLMYQVFWLNQVAYHIVSIFLHFVVVVLLYQLARKILKSNALAAGSALIFLILSSYTEIVVWISGTGHLFNAIFVIGSLLLFIKWDESKKKVYLALSILLALISLSFYEIGIITPFLAIAYKVSKADLSIKSVVEKLKNKIFILLFVPDILYAVVRYFANTFWFSGDYSYNILKLPFNAIGNAFGYLLLSFFGPFSYPFYEKLRELTKSNLLIAGVFSLIILVLIYFAWTKGIKRLSTETRKIVVFSILFFLVCLIPYLGLGNITFRYSYLASFGVIMIGVVMTQKIYENIKQYGRDTAILGVAVIVAAFSLLHIIQAQQTMLDWRGAGDAAEKFINSLDSLYHGSWSNSKVDLYFADVPIKHGDAWVFPVGLDDTIWFAFKNDKAVIHQIPNVESAPTGAFTSTSDWVFQFQGDGSLKEAHLGTKGIYFNE